MFESKSDVDGFYEAVNSFFNSEVALHGVSVEKGVAVQTDTSEPSRFKLFDEMFGKYVSNLVPGSIVKYSINKKDGVSELNFSSLNTKGEGFTCLVPIQ